MSPLLRGLIFVIGLVFLSDCFTTSVSGKRGCSSFGHSCYGGHGKRSSGMDDYPTRARETELMNSVENDNYFTEHNSKLMYPLFVDPFETSATDTSNRDVHIRTLLKKLIIKLMNEYQRSRSDSSNLKG